MIHYVVVRVYEDLYVRFNDSVTDEEAHLLRTYNPSAWEVLSFPDDAHVTTHLGLDRLAGMAIVMDGPDPAGWSWLWDAFLTDVVIETILEYPDDHTDHETYYWLMNE